MNKNTKSNCGSKKILSRKSGMNIVFSICSFLLISICSCKKFLDVEPPNSKIPNQQVFESDEMANAALAGIYLDMIASGFASGDASSITLLAALSADEVHNNSQPDPALVDFETNQVLANNAQVLNLWISLYKSIYQANAVIEGLELSTGVTSAKKDQLRGEALFIRAFCHFYLVNVFGDVPLITGSDYTINSKVSRTPQSQVYDQVEEDLTEAETLLPASNPGEQIRPVKAVATALLARFYLYKKDWEKAEVNASKIISQTVYHLEDNLNSVFLSGSHEAIWQLKPADNGYYTNEGSIFSTSGVIQFVLSDTLVSSFQDVDKRKANWIIRTGLIYLPYKYKIGTVTGQPSTEYSVVFRLAEQYFIRAEARVQLGTITGNNSAESDINIIRHRAGLPDTTINDNIEDAMKVIENERKLELFTEWGHRWFDLKRWSKSTEILSPLKPGWNANDTLYPIPQEEMNRNPFLKPQNPGYE
jgi:hypothetical protein